MGMKLKSREEFEKEIGVVTVYVEVPRRMNNPDRKKLDELSVEAAIENEVVNSNFEEIMRKPITETITSSSRMDAHDAFLGAYREMCRPSAKNMNPTERKKLKSYQVCETPIQDTGDRTEFETGAVRDMHEGKGRCDLLPLDIISHWLNDNVIGWVSAFTKTNDVNCLYQALDCFDDNKHEKPTLVLELAKHFEEGAKKYGENNWQKGIPANVYIDSAIRHYLKFLRGDTDERHDRAVVWNIVCCIWTCKYKPELNSYAVKGEK